MGKFTFGLFFVLFISSLLNKRDTEAIAQINTQTFNYTGGNQTFVVPANVNCITVQAWGGGGASGGGDSFAGSDGGGGAYTTSTIAVTPGTSLTIIIGGGGSPGGPCAGNGPGGAGGFGLGNGGAGGNSGSSGCSGPGGGGGGGTGVMNGATLLLVAGGGGGGGGGGQHGGGTAGGGGGVDGSPTTSAPAGLIGASGTTIGVAGSPAGGADGAGGGGGGGGLLGGGGGGTPAVDFGGSGGAGGTSLGTTINNGAGTTPGNNGVLAGICGTCSGGGTATGATAAGNPGEDGVLVITYYPMITGVITNSIVCGVATATVTSSGGDPGYTYNWTPTGGTGQVSTNLTNGNYVVNITDAIGCTGTANTTIAIPNALTLSALTTSVNCNGLSTGSATATVSGGTGPTYTVGIIAPPQGGITTGVQTVSGLAAGNYTIGAEDGAGCQFILPITITQPNALTIATTQTNVTCFGLNNGIAIATPAGGAGGYLYNWSPAGGTNATASNLSAQTYTVLVTDANSCTATSTLDITQPALPLTALATFSNVTCNGLGNGSATVTAAGGTSPYTYNWTPAGGAAPVASNLTPQTYTATITDFNLCTTTATVNITEPPILTLTATTTNVSCNGLSTGSATAIATGGTGPYLIGVNSTPPQGGPCTGTFVASGLPAGTYTFGVQDVNTCPQTFVVTLTQPTPLTSATTQTNVTCFGLSTGSASVTAGGGTFPYTYSWSPSGGIGTLANGLSAQNYTVTVTDLNLCITTSTLTITQPNPFIASISTQTNVSCFGLSDGSALSTQIGGATPYTSYSWAPTGGGATTASNLSAGIYTITVLDANLCPATATVNITQPALLALTATTTPVTCFGLSTGSATAIATGGTPSYTMGIVTPPQGGISITGIQAVSGLAAGPYMFGVQDANGCTATFPITVATPPVLTATTTQTNVSCFGLFNGSASVTPTGGVTPYTYSWSPIGGTGITASGFSAQNYTVTVTDFNLCTTTSTLTITQPAILTASISASHNDSCNGDSNGNAIVAVGGGTIPYTYSWSPIGGTAGTASNLPTGNYTATVIDAQSCVTTTSVTITQPPVLTVSSVPTTICISNTTTLTATAVGGNTALPYTYSIAGVIGNTAAVSPVTTTIYTLGVLDMKGCIATNSVTVFVRNPLNFIAVSPAVEMCNGFTANLNATGSGGDSTFTYIWNPGALTGQNIAVQPNHTTTYTVTLVDACGTPTVSSTVDVIIDPLPKVTFASDKQNGCYQLCVNFTSTPVPQAPVPNIVTYAWNLGGGYTSNLANPSQCYANPGVYSIYVTTTSDKNCISHDSILNMITVYNHPIADFTYLPDPANILAPSIQFTDASTAPGSYIKSVFWQTFGDGSDSTSKLHDPVHIYQDTGKYCVNLIATNGFGCKDTTQQCVVIKPYFTLYVPNAFSPNGDGINDVFYAIGEYVETFDMRIFDRWGNEIYFTGDINKGWNGAKANTGGIAKEDVYVYMITATDALRKSHSYKGTVTLIK